MALSRGGVSLARPPLPPRSSFTYSHPACSRSWLPPTSRPRPAWPRPARPPPPPRNIRQHLAATAVFHGSGLEGLNSRSLSVGGLACEWVWHASV